jgi:ubiquinone/menaquinone biosynthesis C-methylase UbiE
VSAFNDIAAGYAATGGDFFTQIAAHLVDIAGIGPGDQVLDVGCGKGAVTIPAAIAAGPDGHVCGIDLSPAMLAHAREATSELGNVTLTRGDAHDPPSEGAFDAVLASNVVVFLDDPARALRTWNRLLVPGGRVVFSWGIAGDLRWKPVLAAVDARVPAPHPGFDAWLRRYPFGAVEQVEAMLTGCGYARIRTVARDITTRFASPQEWWQSSLSSAPFAISWRHIPDGKLTEARQDAFALLEELRDDDGGITRTLRFGFTTARTAPRSPAPAGPGGAA